MTSFLIFPLRSSSSSVCWDFSTACWFCQFCYPWLDHPLDNPRFSLKKHQKSLLCIKKWVMIETLTEHICNKTYRMLTLTSPVTPLMR